MTTTLLPRAGRRQRSLVHQSTPHTSETRASARSLPWWRSGAWRSTAVLGLTGSALAALSLPPAALAPLAWIAPIPWLLLVAQAQLTGRRPYAMLWLCGFLWWFAVLHFLRLPHPATVVGWFAMSAYLAFYLPGFVALARSAVHRWRVPLVIAAPVVWVGLELFRSHFLTGFSMAQWGHTQWRWIELIQIADLAGGYAVSGLLIFVAACLTVAVTALPRRAGLVPLAMAAVAVGTTLGYGYWRTANVATRPGPTVAIIQGSIDTELKWDPNQAERVHREYLDLTYRAVEERSKLDAVIWPETMYREALLTYAPDAAPEPGDDWTFAELEEAAASQQRRLRNMVASVGTPMLLGVDTLDFGPGVTHSYNSAILVEPGGEIAARYDKMHPVIFSHEYIPLSRTFPSIYKLTPFKRGLEPGREPVAVPLGNATAAVSICYENVLPHLIARQVRTLRSQGHEPDLLVNLTNDGWFWGSSELDLHLMCAAFRALECRKPMIVAANTGFSAHIDASGRVVARGPRRATGTIVTEVPLDGRASIYLAIGDWPAGLCLLACVGLMLGGLQARYSDRQRARALLNQPC
ncbi:MAG: apolipoprotein N-acyltransferase [Pirellulales bacterium]|nr:apolipoprotein N-acyltransferase [Pirellulales bacterium]